MAHCLNQSNQLALVCRELGMAWRNLAAEDDRVIHRGWLLKSDVETKWVTQACREELNLLLFGDGWIPAGECHEPLSELIDQAGATQHG
jgi:hypothetical protein